MDVASLSHSDARFVSLLFFSYWALDLRTLPISYFLRVAAKVKYKMVVALVL